MSGHGNQDADYLNGRHHESPPPLLFEARRWCKGDDEWSNWHPCTEADAARYRVQGMEVRKRAPGVQELPRG